MDILHIIYEAFNGSVITVLQIAVIVIPLMIVLQFIKEYGLLDKFSLIAAPFLKLFGISKYASLPFLTGLFFGISYGSGVIIQCAKDGLLSKRDLYLTMVFLAICHSIVEDNFLFIAIGADPYILFVGRLLLAVIVTFILSRLLKEGDKSRVSRAAEGNIFSFPEYTKYNNRGTKR